MEITPQFMIGSTDRISQTGKQSNSDMNRDDFLKIMAASLRMPSVSSEGGGSGDNSMDYMSQMIQFSTIEQLQTLTESVQTTLLMTQQQQAIGLIGKEVTVVQDGVIVTGTVEKTRFYNGYATLQIDGKDYYLSNVQEVGIGKA